MMSQRRFRTNPSAPAWTLAVVLGLATTGITPAHAVPVMGSVNCPTDSLATAITAASPGDTLVISGTCVGNFSVGKRLILKGTLGAALDGGGMARTLTVSSPRPVVIEGLTITGGSSIADERGSGLYNSGKLILRNTTVSGNNTQEYTTTLGGGIYNSGTLTLFSSTVHSNSASSDESSAGGGIYNTGALTMWGSTISYNGGHSIGGIFSSGTLSVNTSTVSFNQGNNSCGGFRVLGVATISRSTMTGNNGGLAPAMCTGGVLRLESSTISNNYGSVAITNSGALVVSNSTVAGNVGGVSNLPTGTVSLAASIVAGNTSASGDQDCYGAVSSNGYNLIGDVDGCSFTSSTGDHVGSGSGSGVIDPKLATLANNGGRTQTRALLAGSPALNAIPVGAIGADGVTPLCPPSGTRDQRYVLRPQGPGCEIGAFERKAWTRPPGV